MSAPESDLFDLIRQLKVELEWAGRTGLVPVAPTLPRPSPAAPRSSESPSAKPAGRGAALTAEPAAEARPGPDRREGPPQPAPPPRASTERRPTDRPPERYERPAPERQDRGPERPPERGPQASERPRPPAEAPPGPPPRTKLAILEETMEHLSALGPRPELEQVKAVIGPDCARCKLSRLGRSQVVFGVGNPKAELMFIGEGPGQDEDRQGVPFVGKAGELLTKIIEAGMGFQRSEVYIANVVKCRPPNNRDPEPDEVEQCEPFLKAQIASVGPKVIVALGKHATQALLRTTTPITRLRGRWATYQNIPLMPTYHPAYLLRNPEEKRPVWEDMQEVLRKLGRSIPERGGRT